MPFKIPSRIHTPTPAGVPAGFSASRDKLTATLTEYGDRYELRLWIPRAFSRDLGVCIKDGILVVYEEGPTDAGDKYTVLGCFFLPANAQQTKAQGFYRSYGLKIVMPLATDGILVKVPLIRESEHAAGLVSRKRK